MVINFSKLNFRKRPNFIIRNFDGKAIGVLGHIIKPEAIIRYRDFSEISFTYPSHVNGKKLSEYDLLTGMRIIDVEGFGQFILHNPAENDNGVKSSKSCSGYSLEYEFTNKSISLEEGTYNFWNPFAPDSTILGIILSEMPSWSLGTVSSSLIGKYRTFSVDGLSIYDFMKSELEKTYECVFDFDTYNRKINVRNKYNTVPTKPVYISTSNLAKEIVVEEDIDDLFTVLDVNGADGVDIRSVNPMGENRIYNLDSYMTEEYFSADIIQKWNRWKITFESYQTLYYSIVIAQNMQISRYATESAVLTDMQGELTGLESQKAALLQAVAMDSSLQSKLNTVNSQIKFKESEINSQNSLLTTIQNQISNYTSQLKQINKETAFSSFFTDNELKILDRYFKCGSLTDSSFVASEVDSYSSESSVTRGLSSVFNIANCTAVRMATYTSDITFYTIRGGFINVNDSQLKLNADVVSGTLQVNRDNTFIMSLYLNQGSINGNTFPSGTLSLTGRLYTNVSYGDTSIRINTSATTAYMTYETSEYQRMSIAWDLFEYGKDVLDKKAYPGYHVTVDSSNVFAKDDEGRAVNKTENGLGIIMGTEDNTWFQIDFVSESLAPDFTVTPANESVLESLSTVTFGYEGSISINWNNSEKITIYNRTTREKIAEFSGDDVVLDEDPDDYWAPILSCHITLPEPVTAIGVYDVNVPAGFFVLGEQFDSNLSKATSIVYEIKEPVEPFGIEISPTAGLVSEIPSKLIVTVTDRSSCNFTANPTLTDNTGNSYPVHNDFDWGIPEMNKFVIILDNGAITADGIYTLTIPAGSIIGDDETDLNKEDFVFIYTINLAGITELVNNEGGKVDVYTLKGTLLMKDADASAVNKLAKGMYIINGKKVFIR